MPTLVLKVGGAVAGAGGALAMLPRLLEAGYGVIVVHGGGQEVSRWMDIAGLPVSFKQGLRVTDAAGMEIVTMVLRGLVSSSLVAALSRIGVRAVGLSGADAGMVSVRPHPDPEVGLVGEVSKVDASMLDMLMAQRIVPLIAPVALDDTGTLRNVNADTVCGAIAGAARAQLAVFLTDVPGVLDDAGSIVPYLTPEDVSMLIDSGTIKGGMIPKVAACLAALDHGAAAVCIADGRETETLSFLVTGGEPRGTVISKQRHAGSTAG